MDSNGDLATASHGLQDCPLEVYRLGGGGVSCGSESLGIGLANLQGDGGLPRGGNHFLHGEGLETKTGKAINPEALQPGGSPSRRGIYS